MRRWLLGGLLVPAAVGLALTATTAQAATPCILGSLCPPGASAPTAAPSSQPTQAATPSPAPAPTSQPSGGPSPQPAPTAQPTAQPQPSPGAGVQGVNVPTDVGWNAIAQKIADGAVAALHLVQQSMGLTTPPADWFAPIYQRMVNLALGLYLPFFFLGIMQGFWRRDIWAVLKVPFLYTPLAIGLTASMIALVAGLLQITDAFSAYMLQGVQPQIDSFIGHGAAALGGGTAAVAGAALISGSGSFIVAMAALAIVGAGLAIAVELLLREALIYVCVLFIPIVMAAMIWPRLAHWALRLVELLVAVVLIKFVVLSIIALGAVMFSAAPTAFSAFGDPGWAAILMGAAVLVAAALSPLALGSLIPMADGAALQAFAGPVRNAGRAPMNVGMQQLHQQAMGRVIGRSTGARALPALTAGSAAGSTAWLLTKEKNGMVVRDISPREQQQANKAPPHRDEDHPQHPGPPSSRGPSGDGSSGNGSRRPPPPPPSGEPPSED